MDSSGMFIEAKRSLYIFEIRNGLRSAQRFTCAAMCGALTLLLVLTLIGPGRAQAQSETVIHSFGIQAGDGVAPEGNLIADGKGNFYGTTEYGGTVDGTVFKLSPNGQGGWNETVIHRFSGADGSNPSVTSLLVDGAGNFYGSTFFGGANGVGVAFELRLVGERWEESVLYSFGNYASDGAKPINGLITDSQGNLFGVTAFGGSEGTGSVFELSPSGGDWTEQVIYNYAASAAGLTMDKAGNIFGTSATTVFKLSRNGSGWTPMMIHSFGTESVYPQGTLAFDKAGNLYGTTFNGGLTNNGTVYRLSPTANGKWTYRILHSFSGSPIDGANPYAGIVFDAAGNIYGTTSIGGTYGGGTVFELAPEGKGVYTEKTVWNFNGSDGDELLGGVTLDSVGNLYGTSVYGGSVDAGAVYEVTP
jgi:uncharacterized repeat protein (TIGR03803 family)